MDELKCINTHRQSRYVYLIVGKYACLLRPAGHIADDNQTARMRAGIKIVQKNAGIGRIRPQMYRLLLPFSQAATRACRAHEKGSDQLIPRWVGAVVVFQHYLHMVRPECFEFPMCNPPFPQVRQVEH